MTCERELRDAKRFGRARWELACKRADLAALRASMPRGDALLRLYGSMTAEEIAKRYGYKRWMVCQRIREARS